MKVFLKKLLGLNLVVKIFIGLCFGVFFAILHNVAAQNLEIVLKNQDYGSYSSFLSVTTQVLDVLKIFGTLFTGALKAIAPVLVFVLVIAAIANQKKSSSGIAPVIKLYLFGTFFAALIAVALSFIAPIDLSFEGIETSNLVAPDSLKEVLINLINSVVDNPLNAILTANYLGTLFWAVLFGIGLSKSSDRTKEIITDLGNAITYVVQIVISFAPLGIMGIVYQSLSEQGLSILLVYINLIFLLVLAMVIMALVINPLITWFYIRENPYPLIFRCLRVSGIPAFFTRSSSANIPINLGLCETEKVEKNLYNVSIPLGSTINMSGAAITITTLSLAGAHTLGFDIGFGTALLLSLLAAVSACGASGVAGGSLLLIPLACSLLGIPPSIANSIVGVGFAISIVQDSCETALNSSSDALYTIIVDKRTKRLQKLNNSN